MKNMNYLNKVFLLSLISLSLIPSDASAGRTKKLLYGAAAAAAVAGVVWAGKKVYDWYNQPQAPTRPPRPPRPAKPQPPADQGPSTAAAPTTAATAPTVPPRPAKVQQQTHQGPAAPVAAPTTAPAASPMATVDEGGAGPADESDPIAMEQAVKEQIFQLARELQAYITFLGLMFDSAEADEQAAVAEAREAVCPALRILELLEPYAQQEWAQKVAGIINQQVPVCDGFAWKDLPEAYEQFMASIDKVADSYQQAGVSEQDQVLIGWWLEIFQAKTAAIAKVVECSMPADAQGRFLQELAKAEQQQELAKAEQQLVQEFEAEEASAAATTPAAVTASAPAALEGAASAGAATHENASSDHPEAGDSGKGGVVTVGDVSIEDLDE